MDFFTIVQLGDASVRMAIPLLLACLAGLFSERAGIFDIGLEGKMLAAAFVSAAVSYTSGSVWVGLLAGIGISVVLSIIHGIASITFRGNQLISGVAINFFAAGLTVVIAQGWFAQGGRTPSLPSEARFNGLDFPGALSRMRDKMQASPGMQFYSEFVSGHSILVYLGLLTVPLSWWILYRTRFGLRLRAVGEAPEAVDTAGISVVRLRFSAVIICGILCGIAGAYLSTAVQAGFTKDMTANRGFIALAALIFAKWRPWYALGACLLFGLFFAIDIRFSNIQLQVIWIMVLLIGCAAALTIYAVKREKIDVIVLGGLSLVLTAVALTAWFGTASADGIGIFTALWETVKIPSQLIQSLPYLFVVIVLAGFVGKAIPPRAGGQPYVKER
ncbi:putative ABC transporter permease protein [Octadecabacter antarcticus 307]|uniref:Putative ABC transporter permease protein n=1 Tax=Octadecabacter antarcticus 307 TaxID=391626 RepID=M9RI76_9RHOB|nr:ABC transporter permease [Octadecabacter antarcticus]AGI69525.1 putative ABC transporter permease protein [Octadecabacter antarcticus 307]